MSSAHIVRKAGVHDTAFNHEIHNPVDEVPSEDSDDDVPETKYQYFEFSNGYYVMRIVRLILVIQVIALIIDHPSLRMAVMFDTFCRGIAKYSLQFHFRPFLDVIYVIEFFYEQIKKFLLSQNIPLHPTSVEIVMRRRLNVNPYLDDSEKPTTPPPSWSVDALNDRYFHTMKFYSQYIFTLFFVVMAVLFTVRFWEIHDYSNREEVKTWLQTYIADGWWRRGGLNIVVSITRALIALVLIIFLLYAIPNNLGGGSIPNALYLSTIFCVGMVIVAMITTIGFYFIRVTEAAFTRYVSQNVAYTSAIILKRAVKAKIDIGLILLTSLFIPFVYYCIQAMLFFTDWNVTLVSPLRKHIYYFTPCYYMGFPPYDRNQIEPDSCAVEQYTSTEQTPNPNGSFYTRNILSCDSYWGIILFVTSAVIFTTGLIGYYYLFYSFISQTRSEFINSRWVDILDKLLKIRDEELEDYRKRFPFWDRLYINASLTVAYQWKGVKISFFWVFGTMYNAGRFLFRITVGPVLMLLSPVWFLFERLFIVSCLNFTFTSKEERARQQRKQRRGSLQLGGGSKSRRSKSGGGGGGGGGAGGSRANSAHGGDASRSYSQHTLNTRPTSQRMTANAANAMMMRGVSSPSVDTAGAGGDGSLNSSGWPPMPTSPSSGGGDGGIDPNVIAFDQEFTTNTATTGDTNDFVSPFSPTRWLGSDYERRYSPSLYLKRWSHRVQAYLFKKIMSWSFVVYLRIQLSLWWHHWFAEQRKTEASGFTLTEVGGTHATWRRELTLAAKTRRLHLMRNHVINELRMTKEYFIADHELIISFCDYTIDSSGLMTLCIPYKYEYLWWYLVILFEMMWYAVFGATLRDYDVSWQTRCYLFLMIDILFGVVTFVVQPYTEELDRWLEYSGRVVIGVVAVGLPWYFSLGRAIIHTHTTTLYRPWEAMSFVPQLIGDLVGNSVGGGVGAQFALWIDLFMVLAFFLYLLSIVESIGVFRTFDRLAKAMVFTYHDHILDFLVLKIDERTFGYENIFSGMLFIQQWDDILKLQRRYALLTWPDVRPATLVSWTAKCLEIKWAALFNLTIGNIRSSLGLTLLHIVMSAAESEIARWLIHTNPTLLTVQDSQNDNPITIALKECAYYLLVYGEQESGALDDGTSYSDEAYATYYPEIDDLRDEIYAHGEFIPELCTTLYLTSTDMVRLQAHGVYYEPDDPNHPDYYATHPGAVAPTTTTAASASENVPSFKEYDALTRILLQDQEKLATLTALAAKPKAPDDVFRQLDDVQRAIKLTKRKQKTRQQKQQAERQALLMKRFPEDDVTDDFESGTIHAWTIMDFRMPEDYVSLDPKIMHMMARDPHYHYHGVVHEETAEQRSLLHQMFTLGAAPGGGGAGAGAGGNDYDDEGLQQLQDQPQDETNAYPSSKDVEASTNRPGSSHGELSGLFGSGGISGGGRGTRSGLFSGLGNLSALSRYIDRDLQYVVPSLKKVHYVDSMQLVPFTHPALKGFTDWDRPRRHLPNGGGGGGGGHGGRRGSIGSERQSAGSSRRSFGTTTSTQRFQVFQSHAQTLDIRWKVCRFAEILMSAEIAQACAGMRWSVTDFKLFNKIASVNQGKIAQHLAMVCHLNPPPGFVRISDWSVPAEKDLFDEKPEEELPMMVKGIITVVSTVEKVAEKTHDVVETVVERVAEVPLDVAATLDPSKVIKAATKTFGLGGGDDGSSRRRYSFMSGGDSSAYSAKMRGRARRRRRKATTAVSYAAHNSDRGGGGRGGGGGGGGGEQEDDDWHADGMLPDRVVHYLAEALVCSSHALALDDMEMSYNARRGWRAICRALRQRHASFVVPSLFSPPKKIVLHTLTLTRNELDCGDCVLLCDVLTKQRRLTHVDISFNRIGARGFARMCKALKDHEALTVLFAHHNQIGPGVGKDLGLLLKGTPALAVLDLSYNHLGEIIRYPTMITREKLTSAAHDVVIGLRLNKTLVSLDLSYNHLGPTLADSLAYAINRHPKLHTLHLSGNDLGPEAGPRLLFQLAGVPRGMAHAEEREAFIATLKERQKEKQLEDEEFKRNAARQRQQQLQPQLQPASAASAAVVGGEGSMLLPPLPSTHPAAKNEGLMKMIQSELSMWESLEGAGSSLLGALGGGGGGGAGGGSGAGGRPGDSREDKFDIFAGASFFSVGADDEDDDDDGGRGGGYLLAPLKSPSSPTKLTAAGGATAPTTAAAGASSAKVSQRAKDDKVKQAMRVFSQGLDRAAKEQQNLEANAAAGGGGGGGGEALTYAAMNLTALSLADNQLGILSGHAVASMLERMKNLTYLDVSGNSLGPLGGERVTDQLEYLQGIKPREFIKQVLWEIEESKYTGRNAKVRKKVFSNLTALNMSRNALGPKVMEALALCVGHPNATLTALNVSDNPLGSSELHVAGLATPAATIIREGLAASRVLVDLQLGRSSWETTNLVTMLGGLAHTHATLLRLNFNDMHLDEPSCLQLGQAMEKCTALQFLSLRQCRMGSTGGLIVCQKVKTLVRRQLGYLDLNGNYVGPVSALYLSEAIKDDACQRLHTLYLADNDLLEEGGSAIARAMTYNTSITDLDLSHNQLTPQVAHYIAEFARGLFVNGVKVRETMLTRLLVNDNPDVGYHGARVLVKAVSNEKIQHLEMRNIGAGAKTAQLLSSGLRDPLIAWAFLDVRENHFTRFGLNQLFWAVRNNKRCRVLKVGANDAGPRWCTQQDALLRHGIAVPVAIRRNVVLRELDLSFNSLTSEAGVQILDALIDSHTLKKVNLRGNLLDDEIASMLPDLFRCNNVLEELDLGENRMAFACAFAIAESLEWNRSLRVLALDYNRFGGAGAATLDSFARSIMMNFSLQVLNLDGNKLGPEWGIQLAEVFARNNTLLQVSLRDNRLDTRAGQALLNAYRHAKYMLELALTGDEIGVVLWDEFRRVFEEKRANTDVRMVLREETQLSETQSHMLQGYEVSAIRERR